MGSWILPKDKYVNILDPNVKFHDDGIEYMYVNIEYDDNIKKMIVSVDEYSDRLHNVRNRYILCYDEDYEAIEDCAYVYTTVRFSSVQHINVFNFIKQEFDKQTAKRVLLKHKKTECTDQCKFTLV